MHRIILTNFELFVVVVVCGPSDRKQGVSAAKQFLRVLKRLVKLNNFYGAMAVNAGIQCSSGICARVCVFVHVPMCLCGCGGARCACVVVRVRGACACVVVGVRVLARVCLRASAHR